MLAGIAFSLFLFVFFLYGSEAYQDYELHGMKEAYRIKRMVFDLDPHIKDYGEGKDGIGIDDWKERVQRVILSKRSPLETNPFYHLLLGEIYHHGLSPEKAQGEWMKASNAAGEKIFLRWLLIQEFYRRGHDGEVEKEIQEVRRIQRSEGLSRLPLLASQIARQAIKDLRSQRQDLSHHLIDLALQLDPESPDAQYGKIAWLWKNKKDEMSLILKEALSYSQHRMGDYRDFHVSSANLLSALAAQYFLLLLLVGTVLFFKYEPLARHEWMERASIPLHSHYALPLFFLIYTMPLFLLLGWNWLLFFWAFLIFPYCLKKEKILLSLFFILLFALPFFYRYQASLMLALDDPLIKAVTEVKEGRHGEDMTHFFGQYLRDHPGDPTAHFYFGLLLKSKEKWEQAENEFRSSMQLMPAPGPAHHNLGNLYFLQNRLEEAEAEYKRAIEWDPRAPSTHLNLGLLYTFFPQRLRLEEAQVEFDQAEQLQPGIGQVLEEFIVPLSVNGLMDQVLSEREVWKRIWRASPERDLLAESLWGERVPLISLADLTLFPWILLILLWGSSWIRVRGVNPRSCPKCGMVICDSCQKERTPENYCSGCHAVFRLRAGISPQVRIDSLVKQDRWGEKRRKSVQFLSLVPGAPSLFLGDSWAGLIQAGTFFFLMIYWLRWAELLPTVSLFFQRFSFFWDGLFLIPLLLLYGTSLYRGLRWSS